MIAYRIYRKFFEYLSQCGSFIRIVHLRLKYPKATITFGCHISRGCQITCSDDSEMILEDVIMDQNVALKADGGGRLSIKNSFVGQGSVITAVDRIEIDEYCEIAEMAVIRDQDHRFGTGEALRVSGLESAPIKLGKNVWIGSKATVLKGVIIGDNAVIGASAVVTRSVGEGSIAVGIPARAIDVKKRAQLS